MTGTEESLEETVRPVPSQPKGEYVNCFSEWSKIMKNLWVRSKGVGQKVGHGKSHGVSNLSINNSWTMLTLTSTRVVGTLGKIGVIIKSTPPSRPETTESVSFYVTFYFIYVLCPSELTLPVPQSIVGVNGIYKSLLPGLPKLFSSITCIRSFSRSVFEVKHTDWNYGPWETLRET